MNEKNISSLILHDIEIFNNFLKKLDKGNNNKKVLTERQFFVLLKIYKYKQMELKNLSKELNVSTSSLCILLNKLVDQNFVYRKEDSKDRRNTFYGITEYGTEIINSERIRVSNAIEDKFKVLDNKDRKTIIDSLENIKNIVGKLVDENK